ncbi:hypothetical protein GCM10023196_092930 [Actinoallomurus vinaceus]|uniref:Uncharacterized protein n=1 Tax=Actinoallomurus vinaceus TaxID=1080074 RepID=A0ABP8USV6_9ACTN
MDVTAVSEAVALMAAAGAVSGVAKHTALGVVARIRERVRAVFDADARSMDALEQAVGHPSDEERIGEPAAALTWYARRDEGFAAELAGWAAEYAPAGSVVQNVRAGREAYTAGRDMTINRRRDPSE